MSKPYWSGQGGRTGGSYVDDSYDDPTRRLGGHDSSAYNSGFYSSGGYRSTDEYRARVDPAGDYDADYDDYDDGDYEYYERDLRWRWIAGLAVAAAARAMAPPAAPASPTVMLPRQAEHRLGDYYEMQLQDPPVDNRHGHR